MADMNVATFFLSLLLVGGGLCEGVTDQEFKDLSWFVENEIRNLKKENSQLSERVRQLENGLDSCKNEVSMLSTFNTQNSSIEERVTVLEVQVADLEEDVSFLFDEQVINDQRLFASEQDANEVSGDLCNISSDIESLQDTTVALDSRVTDLEENGGDDGNSSVSELEERVEALEGTTGDHDTRLTTVEENIEELQETDISHDVRITALEENGGGSGNNVTIAFHAVLTSYDTLPKESALVFNEVITNQGEGYHGSTGVFTVPSGGDGFYYFSTYLTVYYAEYGLFDIRVNNGTVCTARGENDHSGFSDTAQAACSAAVYVEEGDEVKVVFADGTDETPIPESPVFFYHGFAGFKI